MEYKRLTARECAIRLTEMKSPTVLIHVRPDGDAVGSAAALCEVFRQLGECASVISADKIPDRLAFIAEHTGARIAASVGEGDLVSIDVATKSQLGLLGEGRLPSLMIDHHAVGKPFADCYKIDDISSAGEALYEVILELTEMGKVNMNEPLAYALYAAISSDTGCFAFSNASARTHRVAAALMDSGIDAADINHRLFHSKSEEQIRAEGFVAAKIGFDADTKAAYATVTLADMRALGLTAEHFETAIEVVRSRFGAEIALVVKEVEPNKYKASLRSTGADVASIAAKFSGGGHLRAAGCSPIADSIEAARDMILTEIKNNI